MSFPVFDRSRFVWRSSQDDPTFYQREALGGEYLDEIYHMLNDRDQLLLVAVKINLATAITYHDFVLHAREAWSACRFALPTIALHSGLDDAGNSLMTYKAAKDAAEVREWATRTVCAHEDVHDLDSLRYELGKVALPYPNGDQTFMHVIHYTGKTFGLLLHTSHVACDGSGAKVMFTLFLRKLAEYVAGTPPTSLEGLEWGSEGRNLLPAMCHAFAPEEIADGPTYTQNLGEVLGEFASHAPRNHGFKVRTFGKGNTGRAHYTFDKEQSLKFFQNVRDMGYTVNQIALAAVALICYEDNPPTSTTPDNAIMSFFGIVDCRPRLAAPYSGHLGWPGYALTMSPIAFPLSTFSPHPADEKEELLKFATSVREQYKRQRSYKSLAAICGQLIEMLLTPMRAGTAGGRSPAPWFSGDGVCEKHLDTRYDDAQGNTVIEIIDYFLSDNKTDPGPFFRVWSLKNQLTLSIDYNDFVMTREEMNNIVMKWAKYLSLLM